MSRILPDIYRFDWDSAFRPIMNIIIEMLGYNMLKGQDKYTVLINTKSCSISISQWNAITGTPHLYIEIFDNHDDDPSDRHSDDEPVWANKLYIDNDYIQLREFLEKVKCGELDEFMNKVREYKRIYITNIETEATLYGLT